MTTPIVVRVEEPIFFSLPDVQAFFKRAFTGENERFGVDPDEFVQYLADHIQEPGHRGIERWLNLFVAIHPQSGISGFLLMSYSPWPMCQNLCAAHFYVEERTCRDPLLKAALGWAWSVGLKTITLTNQTGASDAAYLRMCKKYGKARVIGSNIECELSEPQV